MDFIACPSCHGTMQQTCLPGKQGHDIALDLCFTCQGIWFDQWESLQLAPGSIIELLRSIHAHRNDLHLILTEPLHCPRCDETLISCRDVVKSGRFTYHRCPQEHGRFTVFGQFMIEKGFVRQLNPAEIKRLAEQIGIVRCQGCGAPLDIRVDAACPHCHSAISILDPEAVQKALENYGRRSPKTSGTPPDLLDQTLRTGIGRQPPIADSTRTSIDLITAGTELMLELLQ